MIEFHLPALGSDMDHGKLLQWKIKPGQSVKRGQVVVLDTSKVALALQKFPYVRAISDRLQRPEQLQVQAAGDVMHRPRKAKKVKAQKFH